LERMFSMASAKEKRSCLNMAWCCLNLPHSKERVKCLKLSELFELSPAFSMEEKND
jgi:hypothetical protein